METRKKNPYHSFLELNRACLFKIVSISSDCNDSCNSHRICSTLRETKRKELSNTKKKSKETILSSWHLSETFGRLWSVRAAGPGLTSTGTRPKATWLLGCLSEWSRTVWVSNQEHIPACKRHLSNNQWISSCVRWVDVLSVLTWHVCSLLVWRGFTETNTVLVIEHSQPFTAYNLYYVH